MRVCVVVTNSVWHDPRVIKQIHEYSKRPDIELFVVGKRCGRYNEEEVAKIPGTVEIVPAPSRFYRRIFINLYDFRSMSKAIAKTKADIIHANDLDALVPAYIAAKKNNAKIIYDTHEVFLENNAVASHPLTKLFWAYYEKKLIKRVDKVVCVSHAAADYFAEHYNIERPVVITNCVEKVDERILEQTKHEKFEVLLHGQFYKGRGCDTILQCARLDKSHNVIYALRGFGTMEREMRQYVEDNQLDNVVFYPSVKTTQLIEEAAKSHVGICITDPYCLNFKLSVSNKLFEYTGAGLPVIMSDIPEHRYINDKYHVGIILKDNTPESLLESVNMFYSDKALYHLCSNNALTLSKEVNWEKEFSGLIAIESELLKEREQKQFK